jgi:hypothetical protein
MSVVATYTHRRKTSLAAKFLIWYPDSKKISCALRYLFIYLCYTQRHCSGSNHIVLKHDEQGIGKDAQGSGHGVIYGTVLECGQRY